MALQVKASRRRGNRRDIEGCNAGEEEEARRGRRGGGGEEGEARRGGGVSGDCVVGREIMGRRNLALLL